jgi:hypothetical protein
MLEKDIMNPNFNYAIVAERMQALRAEADAATRARHAARARLARRSRRGLAFAPAGSGR